jgi:hypothetical protein
MSQGDTGTGARRGAPVLERLRAHPPNLWYEGRRVEDPTTHPAMRNGLETLASLYDRQWDEPEITLCDSPSSGAKVGRTFLIPRTAEELCGISRAMKVRSDWSFGMLGRAPDYLNRAMTGCASGAAFLAEGDPRFGENARRYYTSDGRMSLIISSDGRKPLSVADQIAAPRDERAEAFATCLAYAGRYTLASDKLTHHIEAASFQNWVNTDQIRLVTLAGNQATFRTPPILINGKQQTIELVWERLK